MLGIHTAAQLSDREILAGAIRLAAEGRHAVADLIALLVAVDARQLYAEDGYPSLFRFCVARLCLSEEEAYYRIAAARVAARFPVMLERLREGRLTLTAVAVLRKHLTDENHAALLEAAEGRSRREVEALVAAVAPRPDLRTSLRRLPAPRARAPQEARLPVSATAADAGPQQERPAPPQGSELGGPSLLDGGAATADGPSDLAAASRASGPCPAASNGGGPVGNMITARATAALPRPATIDVPTAPTAPRPATITPLAPARYSLRVTISEETYEKLRRAHDLLGPSVAPADAAEVLDRALTLLVAHLERRKFAAKTPRPPAARTHATPPPAAPTRPGRPPHPTPAGESPRSSSVASALTLRAADRCESARGTSTDTVRRQAEGGRGQPARARPTRLGNTDKPGEPACGTSTDTVSAPVGAGRPAERPPQSRYLPAAVRREVWQRDEGRCRFVTPGGRRCEATSGLEFHHRVPYAEGGPNTPSNLEVRCRSHQTVEARRWFGEEVTSYRERRATAREDTAGPLGLVQVNCRRPPGSVGETGEAGRPPAPDAKPAASGLSEA